jgi:hypothetical protein
MRNFQPQQQQQFPAASAPLPLLTNQPCAIYARQSTAKQVVDNPESAKLQTEKQVEKARALGWTDNIYLFVENQQANGAVRSASGTLRIDEREGLSALMELVYADVIKTILVWDESRLFRDEWNIQVDTFIKACHEHGVRVLTDMHTYDFRNNTYDADLFRMRCKAAADFIKHHVKGLLLQTKAAAARRGQVDGRRVSVGYIVDRQKFAADGQPNPNYKKLIPYEPHARVVRGLFKRYRELGGSLTRLYREVRAMQFVFPFFEDMTNEKYSGLARKKNAYGYTITKWGLGQLLTNPVYIGHWYYRGEIVSKRNHEPLVDEEDFWYAFNRLSPYLPNGARNIRATSQNHVNQRVEKGALLDGIITTTNGRRVYVLDGAYAIHDRDKNSGRYKVSIDVAYLDGIFTARLFEAVNDEKHGQTIEERLKEIRSAREYTLVSVDEQIQEARKQIARAERSRQIAAEEDSPEDERQAIQRLKGLRATLTELESKQAHAAKDEKDIEECQRLVECVRKGWDSLDMVKKRRFIQLITQEIRLSEASTHFLKLEVVWTGPYGCTDTAYIWREHASGGLYTDEENARLRELYPVADRATILAALPHRSWTGILIQGRRLGLSRDRHCGNSSMLHPDLSLQDDKIIQALGETYSTKGFDKRAFWVSSDGKTSTPS